VKKIALFHRVWFDSGERFLEGAKKMGVDMIPVNYQDLVFRQESSGFEIFCSGKPLSDFDLFYFRAVGAATEWAALLVIYAKDRQIPIVDDYLGVWGSIRRLKSLAGLVLAQNKVAYPKTSLATDRDQFFKEIKNFSYPFVLKVSKGGRHGIGTFLVQDEKILERVVKGRIESSSFLIQEYIKNDGDYRLFLVGYKVLGAFKRQKKEEKLVLNRSLGPSESLKEVPAEVISLAEKTAAVLKIEICAIDMVIDEQTGRPVVIEANEAPQFSVFEKRTGIDVGEKIVEYLVRKAKKGVARP